MKWLPMTLFIALSPVVAAYSGTFLDDFHDRNLDGWHVSIHPPGIALPVAFKNGYLVMDTTIEKNELPEGAFKVVSLELRTGNAEDWNSYTLTCQIRFAEEPQEEGALFSIGVRLGKGHFDVPAEQQMLILPVHQHIQVDTIPPDAQQHDPEKGIEGMIHRQTLRAKHLRRPIKLDRWLLIKIVAEENYFEFHFDDNFVTQYEDETAVPGTVSFQVSSGLVVHLDDVAITGPEIPNIGGPHSVNPEARLGMTWGEIKNSSRR